jgi:hypothetical protein
MLFHRLTVCCALVGAFVLPAADAPVEYAPPHVTGNLSDPAVNESSGLARSLRHPGHFWTHNDSGDTARLFFINRDGTIKAVVTVEGAEAADWEDMAAFQFKGKPFLIIADVGNNKLDRTTVQLYLIEEPAVAVKNETQSLTARVTQTIQFAFEGGPKDCESVAVDTELGRILLLGKEMTECGAYELPLSFDALKEKLVARRIATVPVSLATAMDISPDGRRAVIANYVSGCEYQRQAGETWAEAFSRPPRPLAFPLRRQGETVCYGSDGLTLHLTSEGKHQPFWEMAPKPAENAAQ